MNVVINGEKKEITSQSVSSLLQELGYSDATYAVAVEGEFVPRATYDEAELHEGQNIEIVAPMQGG